MKTMNILLDTHAAIWFFECDERLSKSAIKVIFNLDNIIYVSVASLWEVAIKLSLSKLTFDDGFDGFLDAIHKNEFALLGIEPKHIRASMNLPHVHHDPFDRILIAQTIIEDMAIMTADANILKYELRTVW